MRQLVVSFLLGLFSFITFFFGEPFGVPGSSALLPMLVGGLATGLYLGVCQFLVARHGDAEVRADTGTPVFTGELRPSGRFSRCLISDWDLLVAMLTPLAGICGFIALAEPNAGLRQAPPLFLGGALGCVTGAVLARATSTHCGAQSRAEAWRRLRLVGATLFCVASLLVTAALPGIPELLNLRSQATNGLIVIASLHLLIAAAFFLKRTPGAMLSAIAGAFGLLFGGFLLIIGAAYVEMPVYVPAALFAGAFLDVLVCGACIKAVVRADGFEDTEVPTGRSG